MFWNKQKYEPDFYDELLTTLDNQSFEQQTYLPVILF